MSMTTNMQGVIMIEVIEFPDHHPPFVCVKFHDDHGNCITFFPADLDLFVRDIRMAVATTRIVKT